MSKVSLDKNQEKKLIKATQKNKEAFTPLYLNYKPHIISFFSYRVSDKQSAEELTSEVFEKALTGIDNYQWQGIPFSAWLFRIARNTLVDFYRRNEKNKKVSPINDEEQPITDNKTPLEHNEVMASEDLLYKVLQELPSREMNIIYMKFFDGYTNRLISKLTGLTETNIGTIIFRTLKRMREMYTENKNEFIYRN